MSARRSLLTASAAGALLGALWFVPSANATDDTPAEYRTQTTTTRVLHTSAHTSSGISEVSQASAESATDTSTSTTADSTPAGSRAGLADTGSFDTTPYVAGGTVFLTLGAVFVMYSIRRERTFVG